MHGYGRMDSHERGEVCREPFRLGHLLHVAGLAGACRHALRLLGAVAALYRGGGAGPLQGREPLEETRQGLEHALQLRLGLQPRLQLSVDGGPKDGGGSKRHATCLDFVESAGPCTHPVKGLHGDTRA